MNTEQEQRRRWATTRRFGGRVGLEQIWEIGDFEGAGGGVADQSKATGDEGQRRWQISVREGEGFYVAVEIHGEDGEREWQRVREEI